MKQNKFLKATFILMIGGLITKILGFGIRIIYTRMVGSDAINLYSLVMPTYSLLNCSYLFYKRFYRFHSFK